jgi:hypothetical protein
MPGIRRTAVVVTAFLLLSAAWATAQSPRQHVLPAGTPVVFVADGHLDSGAREGSSVDVHLRDALVLDGAVIAAVGTHARLLVGGITDTASGHRTPAISLDRFSINAGLLPVRARAPIVAPVAAGTAIEATTLAEVDHIGDRYSIVVPFPFKLSNDQPASAYTPTPARTAPPHFNVPARRRGSQPSPTAEPTAAATIVAEPTASATKIPR